MRAARAALADQEVDFVLPWVRPEHEEEIRDAFRRTLQVRTQSDEARELADLWFFETVVRVHRQREGAPYTGVKPKGWEPPTLAAAADRVLEDGQISLLAYELGEHLGLSSPGVRASATGGGAGPGGRTFTVYKGPRAAIDLLAA